MALLLSCLLSICVLAAHVSAGGSISSHASATTPPPFLHTAGGEISSHASSGTMDTVAEAPSYVSADGSGEISLAQQTVAFAYNATVSLNKSGAYRTLMGALAAAPTYSSAKYYIHVEAGLYVERVEVWKNLTNIVLVGDGADNTRVQWNRSYPEYKTFETATLTVQGNGFIAKFLTFENNAGQGFQAAAVVTTATFVVYYKCIFLGYQDTLYAHSGLQLYKSCDIYGTVDFIFGHAAAVFQSCGLYARSSTTKTIVFTAQNKEVDKPENSGFVIQGCNLTVAPKVDLSGQRVYLGRPWSNYSTVVVMESYLDNIIQPDGWLAWNNATLTDKVNYLEFNNTGAGADTQSRVNWKGVRNVTIQPDMVRPFTVAEFIDTDGWLAGTGIPYTSGFMSN